MSKNTSIYQRIFLICVFWKYFCFWSICRLFHLVFKKNIHENSVRKTFWECLYHLNAIKEFIYIYICAIMKMKTKCPPGYHHNGFVVTHALGHNRTSCAQLHELPQSHCGINQEGTLFSWCYIKRFKCDALRDLVSESIFGICMDIRTHANAC